MFVRNITPLHRNLRVAVGLALDMWFFSGWVEGPLLWLIGIVCIWLLATAAASYCPLAAVLHLPNRVQPVKSPHGWSH